VKTVTPRDNRLPVLQRARDFEHRLVTAADVRDRVHGRDAIGHFNKRVAMLVTNAVGTMWCAYAFAALALVSLPAAIRAHDSVTLVAWISQTFLQLVLLSIIIVGQNIQAEATDARAEADHEMLALMQAINTQQLEILERLDGQQACEGVPE
jgi:hypothetical protein